MKTHELCTQPGLMIRRAHQFATAVFMDKTRESGLTPVQFATLVVVRDFPGIDATRISEWVFFDRSTTGVVIGGLERAGLISRKPGKMDKRTKSIFLTARGARIVADLEKQSSEITETVVQNLSKAERTQFMRLLAKIVNGKRDGDDVAQIDGPSERILKG
jgi:DNA-binding MarR family transcriptional regulator